ncbi:unnamed protein product [Paramecium primaurelia]|uniref:Uncharacterized protein n=1 Tax=Paramecium primaurelia TaxID=5886 RepID=A0A8S1JU90_PARPR|nr:unnamed protein product [Paramecium primaurelia]CAD8043926.1 unnamed protein product [Paramecium primaurelia]
MTKTKIVSQKLVLQQIYLNRQKICKSQINWILNSIRNKRNFQYIQVLKRQPPHSINEKQNNFYQIINQFNIFITQRSNNVKFFNTMTLHQLQFQSINKQMDSDINCWNPI